MIVYTFLYTYMTFILSFQIHIKNKNIKFINNNKINTYINMYRIIISYLLNLFE